MRARLRLRLRTPCHAMRSHWLELHARRVASWQTINFSVHRCCACHTIPRQWEREVELLCFEPLLTRRKARACTTGVHCSWCTRGMATPACLRSHSSRPGAVGPWPSRQTQTSGLALHWRLTVRSSVGWASRPLMSPWVTRATSADCRLSEVDQSNLAVSHTHDTVFAQQLVLSLVRIVASRRWGLRVGFFLFLFMIII
jgi:hypothetical protein